MNERDKPKIELTQEQMDYVESHNWKWGEILNSEDAIDIKRAVNGANSAYAMAKQNPPAHFILADNQEQANYVAAALIQIKGKLNGLDSHHVILCEAKAKNDGFIALATDVIDAIEKTYSPISLTKKELDKALNEGRSDRWWGFDEECSGQSGAAWYDYWATEIGLECAEPMRGMIELSSSCNGWWCYRDVCILEDRQPIGEKYEEQDDLG